MTLDTDLDLSTLPLDEASSVLDRDDTRLAIAQSELERAVAHYQLHVLSDPHVDVAEVRLKLDEQHLPAIRAVETEVATASRAIAARARTLMQTFAVAPPKLSGSERVEAGALSPYIEAACKDRPLRILGDEVRAAVLAGDRATMYAFSQHLPARLAPVASDIGRRGDSVEARERQDLSKLLGVVAERLADPSFAALKAKALKVLLRAEEVAGAAEKRQRAAHLATRPFAFQRPDDVPWPGV